MPELEDAISDLGKYLVHLPPLKFEQSCILKGKVDIEALMGAACEEMNQKTSVKQAK